MYRVVAVALLFEVVEEPDVFVGIPPTIVGRVVVSAVFDAMLFCERTRSGLESPKEFLQTSAVFDVFSPLI